MSGLFGLGAASADAASMESVQSMFAQIMSAVQKSVSHFMFDVSFVATEFQLTDVPSRRPALLALNAKLQRP
jgi:hypothetical protein